jgi:hypothetical protein
MEPRDSEQGKFALIFAHALVAGKYKVAYEMMAASLREKISLTQLQETYEQMIEYGDAPPDFVDVITILSTEQEEDLGWAYVAISGNGYGEAVSVVVTQEAERVVIREIEWGRP